MSELSIRFKWCCWLFACTLLLSSAQVTIVGLQSDDSIWFQSFSEAMGEVETEDSEENEETNRREFGASAALTSNLSSINTWDGPHKSSRYHSVLSEVFSPPPERNI